MKIKLISALAASLLSTTPAFASPVTLDFEGAGDYYQIQNYYNGGTNANNASGTNYGISFGDAAFAGSDNQISISNLPSGNTILFTTDNINGQGALNVASGFTGAVSFYYSSAADTTVNVWSGTYGTGSILGTFTLSANAQNSCSDSVYCHWDFAQIDLGNSVAQSIQFGDAAGVAGFDNVTVNTVPVPAAGWLMMSALGGIGAIARRKRAA